MSSEISGVNSLIGGFKILSENKGKEKRCFALEHLPGPTLKVCLEDAGIFDKVLARFYASCMLSALEHLHFKIGVTHGDIHLGNVVLDSSGYAVLVDFGSSEEVKSGRSSSYGTDIQDFGQSIFQMLTSKEQFICNWKPHTATLDDATLDLLRMTSSSSPSSPTSKEIQREKFFWGIVWTEMIARKIRPPRNIKSGLN